jgi:hypothetical protein
VKVRLKGVDTADSEGVAAELTPANVVVTPRTTRHSSNKLSVGKR